MLMIPCEKRILKTADIYGQLGPLNWSFGLLKKLPVAALYTILIRSPNLLRYSFNMSGQKTRFVDLLKSSTVEI